MKRISLLLCIFFTVLLPVLAQTKDTTTDTVIDDDYVYKMNQPGDQFIHLGVALDIPYKPMIPQLNLGGSGTLGYQHFLTDELSLGGSISFAYAKTIGSNVFYFVPIMAKVSYQFNIGKFEFPISFSIGGAFENYINRMYFGLVMKPEVGAYWRYSSDWSFGIHTGLYVMPQWYKNTADNYWGLIQDVGLSVRYHF